MRFKVYSLIKGFWSLWAPSFAVKYVTFSLCLGLPIGSKVVPFCGSYLGSYIM